MSADRHGERSSPVPIDWWPGAFRFSDIVRRSRVTMANSGKGVLVPGVTTYKQWKLRNPTQEREYGDWVFSQSLNGPGPGEVAEFLWNEPLIAAEGEEFAEELIDEDWTSEEYSWPPILYDLLMILDRSQGVTTGLGIDLNAAVDRGLWRDGVSYPCDVRIRRYASDKRPPRRKIKCEKPVPTQIRGDFYGQPVRLPACLHPTVELESINSDEAVVFDCTPSRSSMRTGNKMVFRATNHQSWVEHVFSNRAIKRDGHWERTQMKVYPPPMTGLSYTQ